MAKKAHPSSQAAPGAVEALLALAAERGWYGVSLADVAARAKMNLVELHERYPGKKAILREFLARLDQAVLQGELPEAETGVRDRLFEVMMRRFDAMQPYKDGVRAILRDSAGDPFAWLRGGCQVYRTAALMLEAAGVSANGPGGRLKAQAVAAIYLSTLRRWLDDDSADMAKTMSALDKALRRVESVAMFVRRDRGSPAAGGGEAEGEPAKG